MGWLVLTSGPLLRANEPAADAPRIFQSDGQTLARVRAGVMNHDPAFEPVVRKLRELAEKDLAGGPYAVTDKKFPAPSGDPHDYVSLAPYFWPNPDTPDGLPYVRHDGRRNPEIRQYDASRFGAMGGHAYQLALAYYLTGEPRYAKRAAILLRIWFLDPATRMNPNLEYAQLVKGVNNGRGTGIIESLRLLDAIDAVGLLRGSDAWTDHDQKQMGMWIRQYLKWMQQSKNGRDEAAATNNHGTWYDVQVAAFSLFIGDEAEAKRVIEEARQKRIASQIQPDGSMPRELGRTNSLGYSVYNLAAMTELADLGRRVGVGLWNYQTSDGRSIRAALDYLLPYVMGRKPWQGQQISNFNDASVFVPLSRAAAAYHDAKHEEAIKALKSSERADVIDLLRFPVVDDRSGRGD